MDKMTELTTRHAVKVVDENRPTDEVTRLHLISWVSAGIRYAIKHRDEIDRELIGDVKPVVHD